MNSPPTDEQELLRRLRANTREAFEALLDRHERRVYNLALRLLGDRTEAEDATQEVFLEVHRALPRFRGEARLDTWVHRIAVNVCLQRRRRKQLPTVDLCEDLLEGSREPAAPDPFAAAAVGELRDRVAAALERLPEGQREVVVLHGIQEMSYAEVAEALGCPVGTVKSRVAAAFRRLRRVLSGYAEAAAGQPEGVR